MSARNDITCKKAVDYISLKEEGRLSARQRFALWRHLTGCSLCRIFSVQNKIIGKAMAMTDETQGALTEAEKEALIKNVLRQDRAG